MNVSIVMLKFYITLKKKKDLWLLHLHGLCNHGDLRVGDGSFNRRSVTNIIMILLLLFSELLGF